MNYKITPENLTKFKEGLIEWLKFIVELDKIYVLEFENYTNDLSIRKMLDDIDNYQPIPLELSDCLHYLDMLYIEKTVKISNRLMGSEDEFDWLYTRIPKNHHPSFTRRLPKGTTRGVDFYE